MIAYALDDSSIINSCAIPVPVAFRAFYGEAFRSKNQELLAGVLEALCAAGKKPIRFVPCDRLEKNLVGQAERLISGRFLLDVLRKEIVDYLRSFMDSLDDRFEVLEKDGDIAQIRAVFAAHERPLKKSARGYASIPEDDDLSILRAYADYLASERILISADEHFWGYADLILTHWDIRVVEEWACAKRIS